MCQPDLAAAHALAGQVSRIPAHQALTGPSAMCMACGADRTADLVQPCSACGTPGATVFELSPPSAQPKVGSLFSRRAGLRKKTAMLIALGTTGCTLWLHNGHTVEVPFGDMPPPIEPDISGAPVSVLRSPIGGMLRYAVAADAGAVSLPWPAGLVLDRAFAMLASIPWHARTVALDVLALGRPDLLARCGLSQTEVTWLTLVYAARRGDGAGVVAAAAALPAAGYRRKIAIMAAFAYQIEEISGGAAQLTPALHAYAQSEPLAGALLRRFGLAASSPRQRLDDLALQAALLSAPRQIAQLTGVVSASHADAAAVSLLGSRGRLAVVHSNPGLAGDIRGTLDVDATPLAVLDDLIEAGSIDVDAITECGRPEPDKTYLIGRIAPARLTEAQVDQLGHQEERVRRRFLAGDGELSGEAAKTGIGRHVAALGLMLRNRPQDLAIEDVLAPHRTVAERLIRMLRESESGQDTSALLDETLLADRTTWLPLVRIFGSDRLRGASRELTHRFSAFFEWLALLAAREHLFLADWRTGAQAARQCLELATVEDVRDEAQNLLACGLHNLGDNTGALRELENAIEGEYSVALLANIGVVAAQLDSELAARQLARIVREAPTTAMRMNAARQALLMWQTDRTNIWEGDDSEARQLPTVLREPLRSIATEPISLEDFRLIVSTMSLYDAKWLQIKQNLTGSPHRDSLEARYYRARAAEDMFMSVVDVLGTISDWDAAPDWLRAARDDLIEQTVTYLFDHLDDPDNTAGIIAQALVQKVRRLEPDVRVVLTLLAVATLTYHIMEQDKEIADSLIEMFHQGERESSAVDGSSKEGITDLIELCGRRIAINLHGARTREIDSLVDPYNTALAVLDRVPRGTALWFDARHQVNQVVEACQNARNQLKPWVRRLENADAREAVMDFMEHCREFEFKAQRVIGN